MRHGNVINILLESIIKVCHTSVCAMFEIKTQWLAILFCKGLCYVQAKCTLDPIYSGGRQREIPG